MRNLVIVILVVVMLALLSGCTMHFKATDLELDAERQRVQKNKTYKLEKVTFLHGRDHKPKPATDSGGT